MLAEGDRAERFLSKTPPFPSQHLLQLSHAQSVQSLPWFLPPPGWEGRRSSAVRAAQSETAELEIEGSCRGREPLQGSRCSSSAQPAEALEARRFWCRLSRAAAVCCLRWGGQGQWGNSPQAVPIILFGKGPLAVVQIEFT